MTADGIKCVFRLQVDQTKWSWKCYIYPEWLLTFEEEKILIKIGIRCGKHRIHPLYQINKPSEFFDAIEESTGEPLRPDTIFGYMKKSYIDEVNTGG